MRAGGAGEGRVRPFLLWRATAPSRIATPGAGGRAPRQQRLAIGFAAAVHEAGNDLADPPAVEAMGDDARIRPGACNEDIEIVLAEAAGGALVHDLEGGLSLLVIERD